MSDIRDKHPYRSLGSRIKKLREQTYQSLPEVSGALEIETSLLEEIERGAIQPTEETLLLLASHFDISDEEADKLWKMAGYSPAKLSASSMVDDSVDSTQPPFVAFPDLRIVYTDQVHIAANPHGVVMNFIQSGGPGGQPMAVSRVGMSREHAQKILVVLEETLRKSTEVRKPKYLPAPKTQRNRRSKKA